MSSSPEDRGEPAAGPSGGQGKPPRRSRRLLGFGSAREPGGAKGPVDLAHFPVASSRSWYLSLSTLLASVGAIASATYVAIDYVRIKPLEKELEEARLSLANSRADALGAKAQLTRAEQENNVLLAGRDQPVQVFPPDQSTIVGTSAVFSWAYSKHEQSTRYILELQDLTHKTAAVRVNVDRPETQTMFFAFDSSTYGKYLWRVRPGVLVGDREVPQGPWSSAGIFTIYPSVAERIRATGKLLVATTPTSYDPSLGINRQGKYEGFEFDLIRWLAPKLTERLGLKEPPALEIAEVPWNRLFAYMQNGQADVAVRSITRSQLREREFQNLRFTDGYAPNHQMFVQLSRDGTYPAALAGRVVGAKSRSINEAAARYLSSRHSFSVNSSFTAYGDLYEALRRGDVALALVDSTLVAPYLRRTLFPLGGVLDRELREFYRRELGYEREEYAALVHEGGSSALRDAINAVLRSPDFDAFRKRADAQALQK